MGLTGAECAPARHHTCMGTTRRRRTTAGEVLHARPTLASASRARPEMAPRPGEPRRPRGAYARPRRLPPCRACTPRDEPPYPQHNRRGSLSHEVSPSKHTVAINSPPRRGSCACTLRRTPLAPPRANSTSIRSGRPPTVRASPLDQTRAPPITYCPALLLTSLDFEPRQPHCRGLTATARRNHLRPRHHHQSIHGEANRTPPPFVHILRPCFAAGELAPPPEGMVVNSQGPICEPGTCLQ